MWKNGRISVDHRIDKRSTCDAHYPISAAAIGRLLFPFLLSSSCWHTFPFSAAHSRIGELNLLLMAAKVPRKYFYLP
jgi:hypothetical protein